MPHPVRDGIFTLGECIPLAMEGEGAMEMEAEPEMEMEEPPVLAPHSSAVLLPDGRCLWAGSDDNWSQVGEGASFTPRAPQVSSQLRVETSRVREPAST